MMCSLALSLAASIHINETYTNSIHPSAGVDCNNFIAGAYYNSISKTSLYAGYEFKFSENISLETALVNGYGKTESDIDVMAKFNYNNFFAIPTENGAVLGIELKLGE